MKILLINIAASFIILFAGCTDNGKENVQQNIIGKWIKETTYSDGTEDTLIFTNDFRVEKYFKYYEDNDYILNYKLKADTVFISINLNDYMAEQSFKYSINGNRLIIFSFTYPFSLVEVVREDVVFIKSQTN
jgi:hypothetical protein